MRAIGPLLHSYDFPKTTHRSPSARGLHNKVLQDSDADLQRAIQLSLEHAGVSGVLDHSGYTPSHPPSIINPTGDSVGLDFENDPDLKAAIEASLRDASNQVPSAPLSIDFPKPVGLPPHRIGTPQESRPTNFLSSLPNYDMDLRESDTIMTFTQTVEQAQCDRDIGRYPMLSQLHDQANGLRPKLAMSLNDTSRRESELLRVHIILSCFVTEPA